MRKEREVEIEGGREVKFSGSGAHTHTHIDTPLHIIRGLLTAPTMNGYEW